MRIPRATYRLQLSKDVTFADAAGLADYLADLGISHVYLSPVLEARPGSTHGYDGVNPTRLNPELGTIEDFRAMAQRFQARDLGLILDIVPNHMGVGGASNPYWLSLLEWGRESPYADWFDVNWSPDEPTLAGKILVPFLGRPYGEALAGGDLTLRFDEARGSFAIWIGEDHKLPLCPATYSAFLSGIVPDLPFHDSTGERIKRALAAMPDLHDAIGAEMNAINADKDRLDDLMQRQNWRVAHYAVAADDLNYRRFFIVSDLAGIRIEREEVFDHFHKLVFELIGEGLVDGLRIDHIDGLYDPKAYCLALRSKAPRPIYLVVEKILADGETLRADWQVDGTTGYEFITTFTRLVTEPDAQDRLERAYRSISGQTEDFGTIERDAKLMIIDREMGAELDTLATRLRTLALHHRATLDLTRSRLRQALRAFLVHMRIYRTYVDAAGASAEDRAAIAEAIARAHDFDPDLGDAVFAFLEKVLTADAALAPQVRNLAGRLQQFTGPVMAKGLEDTALYRYNRLIALCEVGQHPDIYHAGPEAFHAFHAARARTAPHAMLTSSSHDTKRGEDTRARILALTGHVDAWQSAFVQWQSLTREKGLATIDPSTAYYFFQLVIGAWPAEWSPQVAISETDREAFIARMVGAMQKSAREARVFTSWARPDEAYETTLQTLVERTLTDPDLLAIVRALDDDVALDGIRLGLVGTALKLTVPGLADIYQGADLFEQSMVDPDNRRPVDFDHRRSLLSEIAAARDLSPFLSEPRFGAIKLALIHRLLSLRKAEPDLFAEGRYQPLDFPENVPVIGFRRDHGKRSAIVIAHYLPWRSLPDHTVTLPAGNWSNILLAPDRPVSGEIGLADLLGTLPVTVLLAA